jgi:hypothetical protein
MLKLLKNLTKITLLFIRYASMESTAKLKNYEEAPKFPDYINVVVNTIVNQENLEEDEKCQLLKENEVIKLWNQQEKKKIEIELDLWKKNQQEKLKENLPHFENFIIECFKDKIKENNIILTPQEEENKEESIQDFIKKYITIYQEEINKNEKFIIESLNSLTIIVENFTEKIIFLINLINERNPEENIDLRMKEGSKNRIDTMIKSLIKQKFEESEKIRIEDDKKIKKYEDTEKSLSIFINNLNTLLNHNESQRRELIINLIETTSNPDVKNNLTSILTNHSNSILLYSKLENHEMIFKARKLLTFKVLHKNFKNLKDINEYAWLTKIKNELKQFNERTQKYKKQLNKEIPILSFLEDNINHIVSNIFNNTNFSDFTDLINEESYDKLINQILEDSNFEKKHNFFDNFKKYFNEIIEQYFIRNQTDNFLRIFQKYYKNLEYIFHSNEPILKDSLISPNFKENQIIIDIFKGGDFEEQENIKTILLSICLNMVISSIANNYISFSDKLTREFKPTTTTIIEAEAEDSDNEEEKKQGSPKKKNKNKKKKREMEERIGRYQNQQIPISIDLKRSNSRGSHHGMKNARGEKVTIVSNTKSKERTLEKTHSMILKGTFGKESSREVRLNTNYDLTSTIKKLINGKQDDTITKAIEDRKTARKKESIMMMGKTSIIDKDDGSVDERTKSMVKDQYYQEKTVENEHSMIEMGYEDMQFESRIEPTDTLGQSIEKMNKKKKAKAENKSKMNMEHSISDQDTLDNSKQQKKQEMMTTNYKKSK